MNSDVPPSHYKKRPPSKDSDTQMATKPYNYPATSSSSPQMRREPWVRFPAKKSINSGNSGDGTTCDSLKNDHRKEEPKPVLSSLRQLENKQKLMEGSMRRLLRSMKELRFKEQKSGFSQELDKRRRIKLTRMIQILMLQRKNMQLQNDNLRRSVLAINKKFLTLRKRAETLLVENIGMRKYYSESNDGGGDRNKRPPARVLPKKQMFQGDTLAQGDTGNSKYDVRKIMSENCHLKDALQKVNHLLRSKTEENDTIVFKNSQLAMALKQFESNEKNGLYRIQRLTKETEELKEELVICKGQKQDVTMMAFDYEKLKEKLSELQMNYHKIERLYLQESEHRRFLHNQLQEEKGNFRVICRVKPGTKETTLGFKGTDKIKIPNEGQLPKGDEGCYVFNRVFRPDATNMDLFEETKSLLSSCIDGFNVCFLAYGPTGSGKTYSMQGTRDDPGLTLRTIAELSDLIQSIKTVWDVRTSVSMIEIHNEVIYDLLSKSITSVRLSDDGFDVRLIDINEKVAATEQDILFWIAKGHKRRRMAATKLNLHSSRSHLIIRICLFMQNKIDSSKRTSTLIFCDLAGSESAEKIDANDALKIETGHINRSLVTLSRVFDCLRHQRTPVPYRDSKLTHLLKPCLGGQAKCLLIVTISGETGKLNRSIKALQFGRTAMDIAVGKIKQNISILSGKSLAARYR